MAMTLQELETGWLRLQADQDCRNLMARYSHLHATGRHEEYVELWSKRDDDVLEMPWGRYEGYKGVCNCYLIDHTHRGMGELFYERMRGCMFLHEMDTVLIEVAGDLKTAKAAFITPGTETSIDRATGKPEGCWSWGKYGVDFICEDGVWKFWKMRLYPSVLTDYYTCWTDCEPYEGFKPETHIDGPNTVPVGNYSADEWPATDQPEPPLPYHTYTDVKPCC